MSPTRAMLELSDFDQLGELAADPACRARMKSGGFVLPDEAAIARERQRMLAAADRRWVSLYERALGRYGQGVTMVRDRVCQGCHVKLPVTAAPPPGESGLHLCVGCGRLLYWR